MSVAVAKIIIYLGLVGLAVSYEPPSNAAPQNFQYPFANFVKKNGNIKQVWLNSPEKIIEYYKFKVEKHVITTKDGYNITLYRIPGSQANPSPDGKKPILLQHGLFGSCENWLTNGRNGSLAYILSDLGFDVWLGNFRGSIYSRTHQTFSLNQKQYWNFSWHELGVYDLPAIIDFILETTKQEKVIYVGHSQGNSAFFVMLSEHPEYNNKIKALFSLAPVSYLSHANLQMKFLSGIYYTTTYIQPYKEVVNFYANFAKNHSKVFRENDVDLHFTLLDFTTTGASTKQVLHYIQLMFNNGYFRQYDYGTVENLKKYGSNFPPNYNISNIRVPATLFYSLQDPYTPTKDIKKLYGQLPIQNGLHLIEDPKFSHVDFLWKVNVKLLVYDKLISIITSQFLN